MNVRDPEFDPHIPFVPDGTIVSKGRRWARAWKELAKDLHDARDALDVLQPEWVRQHDRIQVLEEGLRPFRSNDAHWKACAIHDCTHCRARALLPESTDD